MLKEHGVCEGLPVHCPLLAQNISDHALGLSLDMSSFALCSGAVNVTVSELFFPRLYQQDFTAMIARLWSIKTHVVLFNIEPKVNNAMNYTRPDKCGIEGGNTGQCSFMKNRSCQTHVVGF